MVTGTSNHSYSLSHLSLMMPRALKTNEKATAVLFLALQSKDEPAYRRQLRGKKKLQKNANFATLTV